jgi:acyl-CoA synthetase (AMP-forming)/AMP-acid ligase II
MHVAWSGSLRTLADRFGEAVAVSDGRGPCLSYRALSESAHALARHIMGVKQINLGDPWLTLLPNQVQAVVASYAIRLTGAAEVPIGWKSTNEEVSWCANLSKGTHVLTLQERSDAVKSLGLIPVALDALQLEAGTFEVMTPVDADAPGRILFTSGTTGKPKGVLYSHGRRWIGEQMLKASLPFLPVPGEKILLMTPFVHGSSLLTYAWCDHGGHVVLLDGVDMPQVRRELSDPALTAIFAPPTVLAKITAELEGEEFTQVRCIFTGTQPLTATIYARAQAIFGPVVRVTYGKSECVNPITVLSKQETQAYFGQSILAAGACVGYPAPGVELRIAQPDDAQAESEDGEIWLRAPQMSLGMITPNGFVAHEPDGWHQTGDLGHIDAQGRLVLTGRVADVIKTGGYRVNPDEIEATLAALGSTTQVCVTSLPSDYWGEIIVAVAEYAESGWEEAAKERVKGLSRHKQPRLHLELAQLPRNPQGKVSRRLVRERVLSQYDLIDGPYPAVVLRQDVS